MATLSPEEQCVWFPGDRVRNSSKDIVRDRAGMAYKGTFVYKILAILDPLIC